MDTNTIISAMLLPNSTARKSYNIAKNHYQIVISKAVWAEYETVSQRPKFNKYLKELDRTLFFASLLNDAIFLEPIETINDCRDPKDNKFLELAVAANAPIIVTGDEDLLILNPYRDIAILKRGVFLELDIA
ncbi:MAG: putative toxin-antitoxin system toxin component, PIN family [Saprospiraceae bacterium]|nr:putative toxin-antitoxin system toxin component, PIN family [Saprospiraceae bacterium]